VDENALDPRQPSVVVGQVEIEVARLHGAVSGELTDYGDPSSSTTDTIGLDVMSEGPNTRPGRSLTPVGPSATMGGVGITVTVRDETATGRPLGEQPLLLPDRVTLRDVIRHRVREEVARYNLERGATFFGLVQPTDTEATLNGYRMRAPRRLDWERQADIAIAGFASNAFFVVVGDRQVDDLDEELQLHGDAEVSFVRLVALMGG